MDEKGPQSNILSNLIQIGLSCISYCQAADSANPCQVEQIRQCEFVVSLILPLHLWNSEFDVKLAVPFQSERMKETLPDLISMTLSANCEVTVKTTDSVRSSLFSKQSFTEIFQEHCQRFGLELFYSIMVTIHCFKGK